MNRRCFGWKSPVGWGAFCWEGPWLLALTVGHRGPESLKGFARQWKATQADRPDAWVQELSERLTAYLEGEQVTFEDVPVRLIVPAFTRRVLRVCRRVAYGQVVTYLMVAQWVGRPRAARAVGQALARNPVPIVIPCHRVVRSNGQLGGFTSPGGVALKRALLALEGEKFWRNVPRVLSGKLPSYGPTTPWRLS
jgi:methylated-DNA-[protein]-cysteine S-methyltransferase